MEVVAKLKREVSRQLSLGSLSRNRFSFRRQASLDPMLGSTNRFVFGRQSSLDPNRRSPVKGVLGVPENLDATMQLLFMACQGDAKGVEDLLKDGVDVNSIDLDGRTALHIAACEGHTDVVQLLLSWRANIDARDRWGSTAAADAKYYGNDEVYSLLKARGAKTPKTRKTPMSVFDPQQVPEYELNPAELHFRRSEDDLLNGTYQLAKWNGTKVFVKMLEKDAYSDPDTINAFKNELTLMQKARHPNVVQFIGAVTQNIPMMIVSEYLPKGDFGSYLKKKGRLQMHKALRFALDIARGINYLHECKPDPIIHCDLRPKNILLDDGGQLKVAGFGSIKILEISPDRYKLVNPMAHIDSSYVAPELYKNETFDRSVDAFSFGLILYEMIEGFSAFHPKAPKDVAKMICLEGSRPILKTKSKNYPPDLNELIEECWNPHPIGRPTFSEIILRLDKMYINCPKQSRWKENLKLLWK